MTPKETCDELVNKFFIQLNYIFGDYVYSKDEQGPKECALIAIEFAREQFRLYSIAETDMEGEPDNHFDVIKQEIEKL